MGAPRVVSSLSGLPPIDGVVVATPTVSHVPVTTEALALGVPIFVEKPLADDPAEAERLAEAAAGRLFVMDKWRYHPGIEFLAALARSGELGAVTGLRTARLGWGHSFTDVDTVWIHAPHDLAIVLEILGTLPKPRAAVGEWVGGSMSGVLGLLGDEPWSAIEISATSPVRRREIRLVCEGGLARLADGYADHVEVAPAEAVGDVPERHAISTEMPLLRELRAFVEHLNGGPAPRSSAAEGAAIVACIAELRSLADAGRAQEEPS
jgi:predicted dehydrogenase